MYVNCDKTIKVHERGIIRPHFLFAHNYRESCHYLLYGEVFNTFSVKRVFVYYYDYCNPFSIIMFWLVSSRCKVNCFIYHSLELLATSPWMFNLNFKGILRVKFINLIVKFWVVDDCLIQSLNFLKI